MLRRCVKLWRILPHRALRRGLMLGCAAGAEHMALLRLLQPATVVDVGANVGQFALAARHVLPQARILSFEPLERPAGVFGRVFAGDPLVRLFRVAAAAGAGPARMHVSARDDSSSLLPIGPEQVRQFPGTHAVGAEPVATARLDQLLHPHDLPGPALLKIDVQGGELETLRGAGALLAAFDHIYVEASFAALYQGQPLAGEVVEHLQAQGFVLAGTFNPVFRKDGTPVQADFLFRRADVPADPATAPQVVVVAPFPPPVHGAALAAETVCRSLVPERTVRADVAARRTPFRHIARIRGYAVALATIVRHARSGPRHLCLLTAGGAGNWYNAACAVVGRLLGYRLFIDHHAFSYADGWNAPFAALARAAGRRAVHFARCPRMAERLRALYPSVGRVEVCPNITPPPSPAPRSQEGLTLGHFGNLGNEKGLDLVLETFRRLRAEGEPVRLVLGGPASAPDAEAIATVGAEWRGPLHGEGKSRFFDSIDVFLFPTRYRPEAQPFVLLEAEAAGIPVIAFGRGCIAGDFAGPPHLTVAPDADFITAALGRLRPWCRDRRALEAARAQAHASAGRRHADARKAWERMMALLRGTAL